MIKKSERQRLELMEKNSLKNIRYFITRCIQGIDLLTLLTGNFDPKFFSAVQKQLNNSSITSDFCNTLFKDLITLDNNNNIRKLLEACVHVETAGADDAHGKMKQKYSRINKVCSTYFSQSENVAFIGVTLLEAAKKEKSLQRKEDLLRQAIEHLTANPLNIDMIVIPQLLVDNGNYTSLADLTLRKIKTLESLPLDQRNRLMTKDEYEQALDQCYTVILQLFTAIDKSVSKEPVSQSDKEDQFFNYFLNKLNVIQNDQLKIHLRDKILRRIEQFNDEIVLMTLFDYLISRPKIQLNIDALPQISEQSFHKICDNLISQKNLPRAKFESIVKLLMKKNESNRLITLAKNACKDYYTINDGTDKIVPLSLKEKMDLAYTARTVLEAQREKYTGEAYYQNERYLIQLEEQIQRQIDVLYNLKEMIESVNKKIAKLKGSQDPRNISDRDQYLINKDEKILKGLTETINELERKILSNEDLFKNCTDSNIFESIIMLRFKNKDIDPSIKVDIQNFVDFISEYEYDNMAVNLIRKVQIFLETKDLLPIYLEIAQKSLDQKFIGINSQTYFDILSKQITFQNTRFELIQYCFNDLMKYLTPSQIYRLFVPKNQIFDGIIGRDFPDNRDMLDIITQTAILKCWMYKNKSLFPEIKAPQLKQHNFIVFDERQKLQNDLLSQGLLVSNIIKMIQGALTPEKILELEKGLGEQFKQLYDTAQQEFNQMLDQHGIIDMRSVDQLQTSAVNHSLLNQGNTSQMFGQQSAIQSLAGPSSDSYMTDQSIQLSKPNADSITMSHHNNPDRPQQGAIKSFVVGINSDDDNN